MSDISFAAPVSIDPSTHKMGFGQVSYGADDALGIRFYHRAVEMGAQSTSQGRPIYQQRVYVEITIPSDTTTKMTVDREATDDDKKRFARHWMAFQQGNEQAQIGTPLETWPMLDVAMVATLKAMSIYSVDQLAALSDIQIAPLSPHGFNLRAQAQAWLAAAKDTAAVTRQAAENNALREQMAALQEQIKALGAAAVKPKKAPTAKQLASLERARAARKPKAAEAA